MSIRQEMTQTSLNRLAKFDEDYIGDLVFILPALVQFPFPARMAVDEFGRPLGSSRRKFFDLKTNVEYQFLMTSVDPGVVPLPYGVRDRALVTWVITESARLKRPDIWFKTAAEFLDFFGYSHSGENYKLFRESWWRIGHLIMQVDTKTQVGHQIEAVKVFDKWRLPSEDNDYHFVARLAPEFYDAVRRFQPLDANVQRIFAGTPTGWDVAAFVQWGAYMAMGSDDGKFAVHWDQFLCQMSSQDDNWRRKKMKAKRYMEDFMEAVPSYKIEFDKRSNSIIFHAPKRLLILPNQKIDRREKAYVPSSGEQVPLMLDGNDGCFYDGQGAVVAEAWPRSSKSKRGRPKQNSASAQARRTKREIKAAVDAPRLEARKKLIEAAKVSAMDQVHLINGLRKNNGERGLTNAEKKEAMRKQFENYIKRQNDGVYPLDIENPWDFK